MSHNDGSRAGAWIQTYSCSKFWPLDPRPEEVKLIDIAHALSRQCRFSGHIDRFYSVAEHSVRVSNLVPIEHALQALLHDASEAYLVDVPSPLKKLPEFEPYRQAEKRMQDCIYLSFGLPTEEHHSIKRADLILLATEARDLFPKLHSDWINKAQPLKSKITPWDQDLAKHTFFRRFYQLKAALEELQQEAKKEAL
jgi:5'-deoxynucleotidase YfbR-like HD superfamily hydrolase